ncbi:plasmid pRiA4b ORF-3 family protein [Gracilibacillus salinarum]|uniref:Plasmid pRiA4b ORF-3 family protein n=1 Tax=Gracilibacillus salinarum TaxID=2932255 RepID=A0ABY4GIY7_9BACI|nr:plasmid pRiA4b ORF-3 family protein [Gracilibacillus salinarum]UOQ84156.1 plasmid pRiA4b ORF-3 family protein [Gracilibacillus salinarum]
MLQLKISLKDYKPLVQRTIIIDDRSSFRELHDTIQLAFQWQAMHLYAFNTTGISDKPLTIKPFIEGLDIPAAGDERNDEEVMLGDIFHQTNDSLTYLYDFGDNWEHEITLEDQKGNINPNLSPVCIQATGIGPGEDNMGFSDEFMEKDWAEGELEEFVNQELAILQTQGFAEETPVEYPSPEDWQSLYAWVDRFKQLKPWHFLHDDQIIAIWIPSIKDYCYCSIMGAGGQHFGISTYVGEEGLKALCATLTQEMQPGYLTTILYTRSIVLNLVNRDELDPEEYKVIKQADKKYRGKNQWPSFVSYKPAYHPWYIDKEEAMLLQELFPALWNVLQKAAKKKLTIPDQMDNWYALTLSKDGQWIDTTINGIENYEQTKEIQPVSLTISEVELARMKRELPKDQSELEYGVVPFPEPVQMQADSRPYIPFIVLSTDPETKTAVYYNMLQMINTELAQETFIKFVTQLGRIPSVIYMDDLARAVEVAPVTEKLGIEVALVEDTIVIHEVMGEMLEMLDPGNF